MDFTNHPLNTVQYSKSKDLDNSTVLFKEIQNTLSDLIAFDDPYKPYYARRYRELGYKQYMWLATKAREGGKNPPRLFWWMLHNPQAVH